MYSAGFNHYYDFALGNELFGKKEEMKVLDMKMSVGKKEIIQREEWKRSAIIKVQTLKAAKYMCEIDARHKTFISKVTNENYMEGHHIIPMNMQDSFDVSLDVYANVVCLCPICHRFLHYGIDEEKKKVLNQLYEMRKDRLDVCGIRICKSDFVNMGI